QAIEDEVGHDLVNLDFDGDSVVLRPVQSFDERNDQDAFTRITTALKEAGYENIAAVSKGLVAERPAVDPATLETPEAPAVEDREGAAEAAVQAIEDEVGHDLVNLDFDGDSVVLRPVDTFDEVNDQDAFTQITEALQALGYEKIAAVGKPLYIEEAPEFDLEALTLEEDVDVEALALPEVDPAFSHVIRA
ncbi:hypothetical protein V5S96_00005, partial [Corynebacterium mastitidis]